MCSRGHSTGLPAPGDDIEEEGQHAGRLGTDTYIVEFSDGKSVVKLPPAHHEVLRPNSRALNGRGGYKWCFASELEETLTRQVDVDFSS